MDIMITQNLEWKATNIPLACYATISFLAVWGKKQHTLTALCKSLTGGCCQL